MHMFGRSPDEGLSIYHKLPKDCLWISSIIGENQLCDQHKFMNVTVFFCVFLVIFLFVYFFMNFES